MITIIIMMDMNIKGEIDRIRKRSLYRYNFNNLPQMENSR